MNATDVREIDLDAIQLSKLNTRKDLVVGNEDADLDDLVNSIREHGLISPVTVVPLPDGRYDLIADQRRLLACRSLVGSVV